MSCIDIYTPKASPFSEKASPFSPLCIDPTALVLRNFEDNEVKAYEDGETVLIQ